MNYLEDDYVIIGDMHLLDDIVRCTNCLGKIFIQCYKDGNNMVFMVKDTGEGFSLEDLHCVFEPLYCGEVSRNRSTRGSGLGLLIYKGSLDCTVVNRTISKADQIKIEKEPVLKQVPFRFNHLFAFVFFIEALTRFWVEINY
ncbi:ATP-binding protein [Metabacillus fastidiosus]|uniref:ATP-binding protein n=1 Tax=Metabacillus fastidiosus TaxID=1458 RepID=UPI003D28AD25